MRANSQARKQLPLQSELYSSALGEPDSRSFLGSMLLREYAVCFYIKQFHINYTISDNISSLTIGFLEPWKKAAFKAPFKWDDINFAEFVTGVHAESDRKKNLSIKDAKQMAEQLNIKTLDEFIKLKSSNDIWWTKTPGNLHDFIKSLQQMADYLIQLRDKERERLNIKVSNPYFVSF